MTKTGKEEIAELIVELRQYAITIELEGIEGNTTGTGMHPELLAAMIAKGMHYGDEVTVRCKRRKQKS